MKEPFPTRPESTFRRLMALSGGAGVILLLAVFIVELATIPGNLSMEESLSLLMQGNRNPGRLMEAWIRPLLPALFLLISAPLIALTGYAFHARKSGEKRNACMALVLVIIISLTAAGSLICL